MSMNNSDQEVEDSADSAEQQEVKSFLKCSFEFKKMKTLAEIVREDNYSTFLNNLDKCRSFSDLKSECNDFFHHYDKESGKFHIGKCKVNSLLYVAGFFSNQANSYYYSLKFYENIFTYLNKQHKKTV